MIHINNFYTGDCKSHSFLLNGNVLLENRYEISCCSLETTLIQPIIILSTINPVLICHVAKLVELIITKI